MQSYTTQQPYGTQGMSINGGNRNAKNLPFNVNGEREWSVGIFDCLEDPITCMHAPTPPARSHSDAA